MSGYGSSSKIDCRQHLCPEDGQTKGQAGHQHPRRRKPEKQSYLAAAVERLKMAAASVTEERTLVTTDNKPGGGSEMDLTVKSRSSSMC